jgi:TonB family protein
MSRVAAVATATAIILAGCQNYANVPKAAANSLPSRSELVIDGFIEPKNIHWAHLPNGDDMARVYPPRAAREGLSGTSRVHCAVEASGILSGCVVVSQSPIGFGFGEAELRLIPLFRMAPARYGSGANTDVPIRWNLVTR